MNWPIRTLAEVCLPITKVDPVEVGRERVQYVDIGVVDGVHHTIDAVPWVVSAVAPTRCRQLLRSGDTVFSTVRPYLEKIAFIPDRLEGEFASTGFCVLRPNDEVEPRFLFHYCTSHGLLDQVLTKQKGVSYPAVLDREVRACQLPVPPIAEQRRIVAVLEEHLSDLDAAMGNLRSVDAKASAMTASARRGAVSRAAGLGEASTLGKHAVLVEYGSSQKAHEVAISGDVPVLRMGNIQGGRLDFGSLKYLPRSAVGEGDLLLERGDLLFNRTNSAELVGKSAVFLGDMEATFASYLIRVRFDESVHAEWANIVVNSPQGRAYVAAIASQQVGQANVNGTKLKAFPLPVPSLATQVELIQAFNEIESAAERLRIEASRGLARAQSLRRAVLAAAFSGRLTGHGSDTDVIEEFAEEESA